jgi:hypothetical protein
MVIQTKTKIEYFWESENQTLENFFGKLKNSNIDAQKMKDGSRKIWKMD